MSIKYILPKDANELGKLRASAIRAAGSARTKIQIAAVATLHHAYVHGDWTQANNLVQGLSEGGIRRDALTQWFVTYGGLTIGTAEVEGKNVKQFTGWSGKEYIKEYFNEAKSNFWDKAKKEADPFKEFDLQAELTKLLARAGKALKAVEGQDEVTQKRVKMEVNEATIKQLLNMTDFEVIEPIEAGMEADLNEQLEADLAKSA